MREDVRFPSDRHTFTSLGLQAVVNAFVYSTYIARLPDLRDQAHLSIAAMGVVMTLGNLAGMVATLGTEPAIRRLGSKRVMIAAGILYVLALPVIGTSTSPVLLVTAIITMMVMNTFVDVAIAMQSVAFGNRRGRPVNARLSGLYSLGTLGGGALAAVIVRAGFDVSLHLVALALLLAGGLWFVGPGLLPVDEHLTPRRRRPTRLPRLRISRPVLLLALASALTVPLDVVPGEWATFRIVDDLGAGPSAAAAAYLAFTVGMTAGRFGGDWATVRFGPTRLVRTSVAVSAGGLVLAAVTPAPLVAMAGFLLAGLGVSVQSPLLTQAAGNLPAGGFTALFVGNRTAGLVTPLARGTLAVTSALGVGKWPKTRCWGVTVLRY